MKIEERVMNGSHDTTNGCTLFCATSRVLPASKNHLLLGNSGFQRIP